MLTVGYSTRSTKPEFIEYLKKSSGYKKLEVIEKINNGDKSLSQVYNEILSESKTNLVLFIHDDIYFDTTSWYYKLVKHFENENYGIIGLAGTTILPNSGQWWEKRNKMIGVVNHESGGKKWTSKYSEEFGNKIKETVLVDGVFIAVDKTKIKNNFVEDFSGFHFYDLPFCVENYLNGVKIGVITNIRITHKSIGMTNQQWEDNRKLFVEKYKNNFPIKVKIKETDRLKVLISCLFFRTFTGSELYVYELAKNLMKLNCSVTVLSQIGGPLTDLARKNGIRVLSFEETPGFKLGDGVWEFDSPQGKIKSTPNTMYKIFEPDFDIIHIQHKPVTERILQFFPEIDKICSIHSEVIELENPVIHDSIKRYIAIRPEIQEHLETNFDIPESNISVIYNPVDQTKFSKIAKEEKNYLLFVGTLDYLRRETLLELIEYTKENGMELWVVGENKGNYLDVLKSYENVKYFPPTWDVEKYIRECKETAGIQLGRTTIEGWLCGKPGWIFKVDSLGRIIEKQKFEPPTDLEKYHADKVAKQIKEEYIKILS
jgi:glycosyltransferase involved in cell wall biosynthesis